MSDLCSNCGGEIGVQEDKCTVCGDFGGYPNVKMAASELECFDRIWDDSRAASEELGFLNSFEFVSDIDWQLVVTMPVAVVMQLVRDTNACYTNYEQLVGSGGRKPAEFANDSQRRVVAGTLFGNFGGKIVYGALSLGDRGLPTYGDIYCRLKPVAIRKRCSFLVMNSYDFVTGNQDKLPKGYRSSWENRGKLAAIKLAEKGLISKEKNAPAWEALLLVSDGKNRNLDELIEGHVYGSFNISSIENMITSEVVVKKDEMLVEAVLEAYRELAN